MTEGNVAAGEATAAIDGFSAYGSSQRAVIEPLVQATGAWPMASDGGMALAAGGGSTAVVEDLRARAGDDEASHRSIAAADRAPRTIMVGYYDPARDYQAGLQQASRPGAGHRAESIELPAEPSGLPMRRLRARNSSATVARSPPVGRQSPSRRAVASRSRANRVNGVSPPRGSSGWR